jgi:AcrR family transcriptional regulator
MNGFQRRREMKKKSILLAAYELFSARGIKRVSIAELAKKAGVSQVSIYNFFESKENLVRQAIFAFLDETMKASESVLESEIPFREKLEKLLFLTAEADNKSSLEFFQSAIINDPVIQNLLVEYDRSRTEPFILRLVEQGQQEGFINPALSIEAIRLYIGALRDVQARSSTSKDVRFDLNALFFYGLQGKPQNTVP